MSAFSCFMQKVHCFHALDPLAETNQHSLAGFKRHSREPGDRPRPQPRSNREFEAP